MSIIQFPNGRRLPIATTLTTRPSGVIKVKSLDEVLATSTPPALPLITDHCSLITPLTPHQIRTRGYHALGKLTGFLGGSQLPTLKSMIRGEEGEWFMEKLWDLSEIVAAMPKTYETDGQGDDAICHLHYFVKGYDGYIIEKDMEEAEDPAEAQWQAHGFVHWAHMPESAECGYICLPEIFKSHAELDLHFKPTTLREIKRKHGMEVSEPAAKELSEIQTALPAPEPPKSTGIFGGWEILKEETTHTAILFVLLGDFYETFAQDAKLAAPLLNVALIKRNLVPMCGIPVHAADSYLKKLTDAGHTVFLAAWDKDAGKATLQRTLTPPHDDGLVSDEELAENLAILQQSYLTREAGGPGYGWRVGAILVETWGYEQTNKNFYQIVERKGDWLTLIPLTAIQNRHKDPGGTDAMRGTSMPGPSVQGVKLLRRKLTLTGYEPSAKGTHGHLRLWQAKPESWTDYA